jgi:hypothetical protein
MSHAFISYNQADKLYATKLAVAMEERGLPVRLAERFEGGAQWENKIEDALEDCRTFVVIMSEAASVSTWVKKELAQAEQLKKPIRPVLLEGKSPWLSLSSIQFFDGRSKPLPSEDFFERVAADMFIDLKTTEPIIDRSPVQLALFDATVDRVLDAITEADQPVYVVDYSRAARARVDRSTNGLSDRFVNVEIRLERGDPRISGFRKSLDENGTIAGQKGWFMSETGDVQVNGIMKTGHVSLRRSLRLEHNECREEDRIDLLGGVFTYRGDRTDPVNRECARDLVVFFERAMESQLKRIAVERNDPTGRWPKHY